MVLELGTIPKGYLVGLMAQESGGNPMGTEKNLEPLVTIKQLQATEKTMGLALLILKFTSNC